MNQSNVQSFDPQTSGAVRWCRAVGGFRIIDTAHVNVSRLGHHAHELASLNLVLCGGLPETYGCRTHEYPTGFLVYKPPNYEHANDFRGRRTRTLIIELDQSQFESMSEYESSLMQQWDVFHPRISAIAQRLYAELVHADSDSALATESLCYELFSSASRESHRLAKSRRPKWMDSAVDYLHAHFQMGPTIADVAAQVGVCPTHFARAFRKHVGCTPGDLIRSRRLALVLERLFSAEQSCSQIAAEAGYSDESHMIRAVRNAVGVTPGSIRRAARRSCG